MAEKAKVGGQRRISSIWIIPGLALAIGAWMVARAALFQDPMVEIRFETAAGIEAGRTKVRVRSVEVGLVDSVRLGEDSEGVVVEARIDREASELLREGSKFWVVRPRIGIGGISGVGTLLSGAYIELEPGDGEAGQRRFRGLEEIPATPLSAEGLRVTVGSGQAGSINVGDPALFRGRKVGQVDAARFDVERNRFEYDLFVRPPYADLVNASTRFWKASAVRVEADAEGVSFNADSLESILAGGVAFDLPEEASAGEPAEDGDFFQLYENWRDVNRYPYKHYAEYLALFNDSVRGLHEEAAVEYRGVQIGYVVDVGFKYLGERELLGDAEIPVPALLRLYPGYLEMGDSEAAVERMRAAIEKHCLEGGLRAALHHGNLLTGRLFVSLDFYESAEPVELREQAGYAVLPSQETGLERIERKVTDILDTVDGLPLDALADRISEALQGAQTTLAQAKAMMADIDRLFADDRMRELPGRLNAALEGVDAAMAGLRPESRLYEELEAAARRLNETARDLQRLLQRLERKPNDLLFSQPAGPDPEPRGGKE